MAVEMLTTLGWELALFAAAVGLVFALDDLVVDALWLAGVRRKVQQLAHPSAMAARPLHYAVFVPAWREAAVIENMLMHLSSVWGRQGGSAGRRFHVYVGVYANDVRTIAAATRIAACFDWIQLVIVPACGPTTKGDCLNHLWHGLQADIQAGRLRVDAVLLHDAEDVVAAHELAAHDHVLARAEYSQLPVRPLVQDEGRWIGGHYADEFAEAHMKELAVRDMLGAPLPTAGVGCAIRLDALARITNGNQGPFNAETVTEDYTLGLALCGSGARGQLALFRDDDGVLIATESLFPDSFARAVRQKTRWTTGIALQAWDAHGWHVRKNADELDRLVGRWMLWRDRRTLLCAAALLAGYIALPLMALGYVLDAQAAHSWAAQPYLGIGATFMGLLLGWRLAVRTLFSVRMHGWRVGMLAAPRQLVANGILVACSWRALAGYVRLRSAASPAWDKTEHEFPAAIAARYARR